MQDLCLRHVTPRAFQSPPPHADHAHPPTQRYAPPPTSRSARINLLGGLLTIALSLAHGRTHCGQATCTPDAATLHSPVLSRACPVEGKKEVEADAGAKTCNHNNNKHSINDDLITLSLEFKPTAQQPLRCLSFNSPERSGQCSSDLGLIVLPNHMLLCVCVIYITCENTRQ